MTASTPCRTSARSALADLRPAAAPRGAAAAFCLALTALALVGCDSEEPYVAPTPTPATDAVDPAAAASTLRRLETAIRREDLAAGAELGEDADSAELLRSVVENAAALRLTEVTFRYVEDTGSVSEDGWEATVETTWRIAGFDPTAARAEIDVDFTDGGDAISALASGRHGPLWVTGPLAVARTADTLVLVSGRDDDVADYAAEADRALDAVRRVLSGRDLELVVEVPASGEELHRALGVEPGSYASVAAVTTSPDGSNAPGAPAHVFVNPDVYDDLEDVAAQVVMSHEAVHVVTAAPQASNVEPWVLEGFADYVALRDVDLPVQRTAGQVIEQVEKQGVPDALPSRADFDPGGPHFGAAYEGAWLVWMTLVERAGEAAAVAFYEAVLDGSDVGAALRRHFDWSLADLTAAWQDRLAELAGVSE